MSFGVEQEGDALVACVDDEPGLGSRLGREHQPGENRQPIHRPLRMRSERDEGEQPFADARAGAYPSVGRVIDDRAGVETNDDPFGTQRHRRELHRIEVDQFHSCACACDRRVIDLDDRDRRLIDREAVDRHCFVLCGIPMDASGPRMET